MEHYGGLELKGIELVCDCLIDCYTILWERQALDRFIRPFSDGQRQKNAALSDGEREVSGAVNTDHAKLANWACLFVDGIELLNRVEDPNAVEVAVSEFGLVLWRLPAGPEVARKFSILPLRLCLKRIGDGQITPESCAELFNDFATAFGKRTVEAEMKRWDVQTGQLDEKIRESPRRCEIRGPTTLARLARQWKKVVNDLLNELEMTEERLMQQDLRIEDLFLQAISRISSRCPLALSVSESIPVGFLLPKTAAAVPSPLYKLRILGSDLEQVNAADQDF
jgi:hypothetical protein